VSNEIGDAFGRLTAQVQELSRRRKAERAQQAAQGQAAGRGAADASVRAGQDQPKQASVDPELERRYAALGGSSPAIAGRDFPSAASVEYAAEPDAQSGQARPSGGESDARIRELEDELQRTHAALGGAPSAVYPTPQAPDEEALDRSAGYRPVGTYGYEYKDPGAPGAAPGPQSGPMADELKGLPGVVKPGPDGFDRVDLGRLSLNNASELGQHRRELDDKADRSEVEKLRRQLAALGGATSTGTPDERLGAALGQY
jgi:hypothetical protein